MQYINVPAGTYTLVLDESILAMNTAKIYLQCETDGGAINILLPRITDGTSSLRNWWFNIYINDVDGNASTNNITITPHPSGDKINGSTSQVVLDTNGVTGCLQITGVNSWEFTTVSSNNNGSIVNYQATATDDITTTSTTDVVATGMTLTPPAGTYLVWFSGSVEASNSDDANAAFVSIYSNGVQIQSSEQIASKSQSGFVYPYPFNCVAKVTVNGSQAIEGRWRELNNTNGQEATMHQRNLTILKVG